MCCLVLEGVCSCFKCVLGTILNILCCPFKLCGCQCAKDVEENAQDGQV